jgi:hypothetical protein
VKLQALDLAFKCCVKRSSRPMFAESPEDHEECWGLRFPKTKSLATWSLSDLCGASDFHCARRSSSRERFPRGLATLPYLHTLVLSALGHREVATCKQRLLAANFRQTRNLLEVHRLVFMGFDDPPPLGPQHHESEAIFEVSSVLDGDSA